MIEKRQKATKVKCNGMNLLKNSQDSWNIFFFRRNFEVRSQKNTKLYHNRPGEKQNFQLELHDHQICYVSIDLRHQYRISVAEAQTSLGARSEERRLYSLANNLQKKKEARLILQSEITHFFYQYFRRQGLPSSGSYIQ